MNRVIFCIAACSLLYSCQDDDSFTKSVDFVIDNSLASPITGKIYTTKGSSEAKLDSVNFTVEASQTETITWEKPDMSGEGSFELRVNQELDRRFGYFTNGVSPDGSFDITIEADTIVVF